MRQPFTIVFDDPEAVTVLEEALEYHSDESFRMHLADFVLGKYKEYIDEEVNQ